MQTKLIGPLSGQANSPQILVSPSRLHVIFTYASSPGALAQLDSSEERNPFSALRPKFDLRTSNNLVASRVTNIVAVTSDTL